MMLFLKVWWKWIAVGMAVAALAWAVDHYRGKADLAEQRVETVAAEKRAAEEREGRLIEERRVLIDNSKAWAATARRVEDLARATATARAAETAALSNIAAEVAAAKEGIKNAPGADDRFDFSDAAYGVVRGARAPIGDTAGSGGAGAGQAASRVGGR